MNAKKITVLYILLKKLCLVLNFCKWIIQRLNWCLDMLMDNYVFVVNVDNSIKMSMLSKLKDGEVEVSSFGAKSVITTEYPCSPVVDG